MICANLDRLEVYVAGAHFATATPDTTNYRHLRYPPSFVDFGSVDGSSHPQLRIDGYLGATKVASQSYSSDPDGDRLHVTIDDTELTGDGSDSTRVVLRAVDRHGQPRPYVQGDVILSVDGPAVLIGDNPFALADTGAAGAVWLRTIRNTPGTVTLTARHPTLGSGAVTARISQSVPGGSPAPNGTLQAGASVILTVPGVATTVAATFTNNGQPTLSALALSLQLPADWSAQATTRTSFTDVNSGQQVSVAWQVTPPADATPADHDVTIMATYTAPGERGVSTTTLTFKPVVSMTTGTAPLRLLQGTPSSFQVSVTNNQTSQALNATLRPTVPDGWTVQPTSSTINLPAGQVVNTTFTVTPAPDAAGDSQLTLTAQGDWGKLQQHVPATVAVAVAVIGTIDISSVGFALAPNQYTKYPTTFPNDVDFTIGQGDPATGWSYIHPGPADAWAGAKSHTFTLRLNLPQAPDGDLVFTAWLVDTQQPTPPQITLTLNAGAATTMQLAPGGGGGYHWGDGTPNPLGIVPTSFDYTLPLSQLRNGSNVITITTNSGSWFVYDAFAITYGTTDPTR